jgi:microcystin-dependent protein
MRDTGYPVNLTNGDRLGGGVVEIGDVSQVANSIADTTLTSIGLPRRGARSYSELLSENFVHALENFAFETAPVNPLVGQLWYDTSTTTLCIYKDAVGDIPAAFVPVFSGFATGLTTAVTISIKDTATNLSLGSVSFDGTTNVAIPLTLSNSGVVPGTYTSPTIVVDAKGRITSAVATAVGSGAIVAALGYVPANDALVVHKSGDTMTGSLAVTNADVNVTGTGKIKEGGNPLIPRGIISMWSGTVAPAGWAICDGTQGTPNLTGRFVVGLGGAGAYTLGQTGGANLVSVSTDTQGSHNHGGSGGTDSQGNHSHGSSTDGHQLNINEIPSHTHIVQAGVNNLAPPGNFNFTAVGGNLIIDDNNTLAAGGSGVHAHGIEFDGTHAHNLSIGFDGSHAHAVSFDNRPQYFALAYIMKL